MISFFYCFLLPSVPGNAPENVESEVLSSTSINVSWGDVPPIDQNGIITVYEVLVEPLETFGGILLPLAINTTEFEVEVLDLSAYVSYNISVRAYTTEGPGPYSEPIANRTLEEGMNVV